MHFGAATALHRSVAPLTLTDCRNCLGSSSPFLSLSNLSNSSPINLIHSCLEILPFLSGSIRSNRSLTASSPSASVSCGLWHICFCLCNDGFRYWPKKSQHRDAECHGRNFLVLPHTRTRPPLGFINGGIGIISCSSEGSQFDSAILGARPRIEV
jgi:hypothetical protein